jgi:TRAP-type mannitol/chloroaromatic compound transport system permease large subunit
MSAISICIMFAALIGAILLGFPVAFSIAGVATCSPISAGAWALWTSR